MTDSSILADAEMLYRMCGKTPDMAKVAQHSAALLDKFKAYDRILAQSAFIAGDELTIADLWHAPTLTLLGKVCANRFLSARKAETRILQAHDM